MKSVMKATVTVLRATTEMSLENVFLWITVRASDNFLSGVKASIFVPAPCVISSFKVETFGLEYEYDYMHRNL